MIANKISNFFVNSPLNLNKREHELETTVSSSLLSVDFEKIVKGQLNAKLQSNQNSIDRFTYNFFLETVFKVVNFVVKFFNKAPNRLDRLLALNEVGCELRKKHFEIINFSTIDKISLNLLKHRNNPHLSKSIQLGIYELQKFEYKLFQEQISLLRACVRKKTSSKEELKAMFFSMPKMIRSDLIEQAKSLGFTQKDVEEGDLRAILLTKTDHKVSILNELEHYYNDQIKMCQKIIDEKRASLCNDALTSTEGNVLDPVKERYAFDASADLLTNNMRTGFLKKPISIVMVAVEYASFIKEGGLAEAVEGLCRGLKEQHKDNKVTLVFPKFSIINDNILVQLKDPKVFKTPEGVEYKVYSYLKDGVECKFIEHPAFDISGNKRSIYGPDEKSQCERFAVFNNLTADFIYQGLKKIDIIHLHDWHASGVGLKLKGDHKEEWDNGKIPPVVFTYHNGTRVAQGRIHSGPYSYDPVVRGFVDAGVTKANDNLFVKTIREMDVVTTVSEGYAMETQDPRSGEGVSFAVRDAARVGKLVGIINGTNPYKYNPEVEPSLKGWRDVETGAFVDLTYHPDHPDIIGNRELCKTQLQKWLNKYGHVLPKPKKITIDPSKPLITYVGRFDSGQKGLDKFEEAIEATLKSGGQFICMGTGEDSVAKQILDGLEKKYIKSENVFFVRDYKDPADKEGRLFVQGGSDERPGIGFLIRACSDFIFAPSSFEPCGLVQFEGWLFGALAIGSKTGGLADTIISREKSEQDFNGFLFCREGVVAPNCSAIIQEALDFWKNTDKTDKNAIIKRVITTGRKYGWTTSAKKYTPVENYRFSYELAMKRSRLRKVGDENLYKLNPVERLKILPKAVVSHYSILEESYLQNYYNAKRTGISSKELETLFLRIPEGVRSAFPSPYGVNVDYEKHLKFGSIYTPKETSFSVHAPYAKSVKLVLFDEHESITEEHEMRQDVFGAWSYDISKLKPGQKYQYRIEGKTKIDPYSRNIVKSKHKNRPPYSVVVDDQYKWADADWMKVRGSKKEGTNEMSIYEVHPTTWKKKDGHYMNYRDLAVDLVKHVKRLGFTHVELMGILEHPDERSGGYQNIGWFAPNSRMGSVDDFKYMVEYLHKNKVGVILDWVPGHFAVDDYALSNFDGSKLFETSFFNLKYLTSLRKWFYSYGSKHFDYTKKEVRDFLISSAYFWLKEMHVDGLRVDCVSGIVNSEEPEYGALFLKEFNNIVHEKCDGAITIAEDFSGKDHILRQTNMNGLGFDLQWNVSWNHFTLDYFSKKASERRSSYNSIVEALNQPMQQNKISFFSHDEVSTSRHHFLDVFKKLSFEQKTKNLKSMVSFLMTSGGGKLLFSGIELMNEVYWDTFVGSKKSIMDDSVPLAKFQEESLSLISALSNLYKEENALHLEENTTMDWINDSSKTVHAYRRKGKGSSIAIFHNFTDADVKSFIVSIPKEKGKHHLPVEIFSSDDEKFGGQNRRNHSIKTEVFSDKISYTISIPPLTTILVKEI